MESKALLRSKKTAQIEEEESRSGATSGLSIGVPGQVKGLYEAHQQFGRLSWSELIQPSIELAEKRFTRPVLMSRFDDDMTIHSFPPPASGAMLALILNILDNENLQYNSPSLGTTHVCVLDEHGDGVAITSTINY
ncbi:glutathione hydrolase 7-like, partial [Gigantopelta aegis]|uniref:glutathione hydrolase 7-like n=1 Tax=Gigantopelta aegis TaxID=1735272 RepID=UPI001B88B1D5